MTLRRALLSIVLAVCAPVASWAQAPLTLREAIRVAQGRDARVVAAAARSRAAASRRALASLDALPDVLVGGGVTAGFPGSGSNLQLRGMLSSPFFRTWAVGVDASWDALELLRAPLHRRGAEAAQARAEAERDLATRAIALTLIEVFEQTLDAEARRDLLADEARARAVLLGVARAAGSAGVMAADATLPAEVALADAQTGRDAAAVEVEVARASLESLLGDPRARTAPLVLDAPEAIPAPELRVARALRREADAEASLRGMELVPRVTLGGSLGYANPGPGAEPGFYAAGVGVSLPLTGALRAQARRGIDAANLEAAAATSEAAVQALATRVAALDASLRGMEVMRPGAEESSRLAEQGAASAEARVRAGLLAWSEAELARVALRRARVRLTSLRVHADGLRARLALLGGP